jgi:hypothetical protein
MALLLVIGVARGPRRSEKKKRLSISEGQDTVVTSMVLPRGLHRRAMITAYELNWSMAELIRSALEEWLDRHADAGRTGGEG